MNEADIRAVGRSDKAVRVRGISRPSWGFKRHLTTQASEFSPVREIPPPRVQAGAEPGKMHGFLCPRGDLNPEAGEISPIWGDHARSLAEQSGRRTSTREAAAPGLHTGLHARPSVLPHSSPWAPGHSRRTWLLASDRRASPVVIAPTAGMPFCGQAGAGGPRLASRMAAEALESQGSKPPDSALLTDG
jgi:hypothetical protein